MEKLDLRHELKHLYLPSAKEPVIVDVPPMQFVMIDGAIEPGGSPGISPLFAENMQALYGAAYTLKFMSKQRKENPIDFTIMALEGLWWVEDGRFDISQPDNWKYTVMMLQPPHITQDMFQAAVQKVAVKHPSPALARLRLATFHEGLSVQMMHIGPYSEEPATVARMEAYARDQGYRLAGRHHEIYMGDPRRGDPQKLKTVLRHAVEKAE